ncbi:protein CcmA, bactofilin family [Desulfobaculum bizertense DSM 18034]|uniref:Protein CcmA, bactofilin family n=2 Tax=Desulfobaculum TaxID=1433996 RepID=A0A1T4WSA6_9BACT|nr:protein CcmA, bactofilin family [Desulfobaculum bizertense DSM 18034]
MGSTFRKLLPQKLSHNRGEEMARDEINAFLGAGTSYEGRLEFKGSVRIDGAFKGEIESEGTLVIGKEALVEGTISVGQLIVSGRVTGTVTASGKTTLHKTAYLEGQLSSPKLVMEEGAVLEGQIQMGTKKSEQSADVIEFSAGA